MVCYCVKFVRRDLQALQACKVQAVIMGCKNRGHLGVRCSEEKKKCRAEASGCKTLYGSVELVKDGLITWMYIKAGGELKGFGFKMFRRDL